MHSNGCFTAGGPHKLTGFLTLTDTRGRAVPNPVFELDGCLDPNGDNSATGVGSTDPISRPVQGGGPPTAPGEPIRAP